MYLIINIIILTVCYCSCTCIFLSLFCVSWCLALDLCSHCFPINAILVSLLSCQLRSALLRSYTMYDCSESSIVPSHHLAENFSEHLEIAPGRYW